MKKNPSSTHSLAHNVLRGTLAVAQVFDAQKRSALSATIIGMAQPTLPDAIASLQPLIGVQGVAL